MKLRIQSDSVRLRLSQTEVARFAETGRIEETLNIAPVFRYALETGDTLSVSYLNNTLLIIVPAAESQTWATTDQVGITGGTTVKILVEKDFPCLHSET
ncbi:MAG: hypothetical protein M3O35_17235 [Acidobacteriota bacterium]|nr:hypothetical protein [Acidobacteriota bacterium]